jgi:Flp pilus assembly protein TadG
MRWLRRDDGIVLILVAGLLVVLLGMAGLAVDLGALYSERRQLRNGADAAALAIAEDCARHPGSCTTAAEATAQWYANANSDDGASQVQVAFPESGKVRVVTSAFDGKAGASGVRVPLMSLFGHSRVDVTAAATAEFGYPVSGTVMPLIIDRAEYGQTTLDDFAWRDGGIGCPVTLTAGVWRNGPTSDDPECPPQYLKDNVQDKVVLVALGSNEEDRYRVAGFAYFHVTGYKFSADPLYQWFPSGDPCPSAPACLQGYFVERTVSTGDPGGADFGAVLVKLVE